MSDEHGGDAPELAPLGPRNRLISPLAMRRLVFLLLVGGVTYWFFDLVRPFLMPVFWAAVLTIVFFPAHRWVQRRVGEARESLAATLTTLLIVVLVLGPLSLIVLAVVAEAEGIYARIDSGELNPTMLVDWFEAQIPAAQMLVEDYGVDFDRVRENVTAAVTRIGRAALDATLAFGQNFLAVAVDFFLMAYLLWFFLRDGRRIVELAIRALPLGDADERALFTRFATVSRATLKGTLIVATIQGTLGGLIFWALGIEGALLWGVLMILLSLLPVGGSAIVWVPAAVVLAVQGAWGKAVILVAFGALAIGLVDNLLRPLLVGRDTRMPDYLVLVATLGGLAAFGLAGFVIGPVVAALFLSVWEMMMREFEEPPSPTAEGAATFERERGG